MIVQDQDENEFEWNDLPRGNERARDIWEIHVHIRDNSRISSAPSAFLWPQSHLLLLSIFQYGHFWPPKSMKVIADLMKQNDRSFLTWAKGVLSLQITSYKFVLFKDSRTGSLIMNFCLPHKLGYGRLSSQRFEYYPYSKSRYFSRLEFFKSFFVTVVGYAG